MIEQRNVAEELADSQRGQDFFLAHDVDANAQFAFEDEIHGIAALALLALDDVDQVFGMEMQVGEIVLVESVAQELRITKTPATPASPISR